MKQKNFLKILFWALLGAGALGFLAFSLRRPVAPRQQESAILMIDQLTTVESLASEAGTAESVPDKQTKQITQLEEQLSDPFALRVSVSSKQSKELKAGVDVGSLRLEGIWVDAGLRAAFISGQAVIEGDEIMGWRVEKIAKTQVELVSYNKRKVLKLEEE